MAADIGQTLRDARLRQKIDMTEVEAATKIRAKYLRALENEEWDLLPGPTFVKTFLRTYGEYLGLDARLLVEEYRQGYERLSTQDLTPFAPGLGGTRARRRMRPLVPPPVLIGVALFAILIGALYVLGTWGDDESGEPPAPRSGQDAAAEGQDRAAERRRERRERRAARARRRERAAAARVVQLSVVPAGEVYVCLVDGSGRQVVPGQILAAGDRRGPYRSRRFRVTLGNGQVSLRVGGRTVQIAETSDPVGYEITPRGRRALPESQRPSCT